MRKVILAMLCAAAVTTSAQKYVGGDISMLPEFKNAVYKDKDGATVSDPLTYFKEQGMNAMRVRLFVEPKNASDSEKREGVIQDLDYVKALGKQIKDAGFKLMLDFHYSDTWADPAKQWTPASWGSYDNEQLYITIYEYTKDVLQQMIEAGATPDFIQTGNEISYGMLWKTVNASSSNKTCYTNSDANWDYFTTLLKQAGKACREVCPEAKIIIHTERVAQPQVLSDFYKRMATYEVAYDIIGLSYYPYFHGRMSALETALTKLETNYADKRIMIVETGYPYAWEVPGTTVKDITNDYPYSDEGQRAFTADLITLLNKHANVDGLFWWYMEYNPYGINLEKWYNAPLVDGRTGQLTSAFYEMKNFGGTASGIHEISGKRQDDDTWHTLEGIRVAQPSRPGVYIRNGQKMIFR